MKYVIDKLGLINFRVFKGEKDFVLRPGLTLIHGSIGAGKSTLIQSIEYCLYGEQLEVKEKIARLLDLINEESDYAKVSVSFMNGDSGLIIQRSLVRQRDSARQELIINGDKGSEEELAKLIGLSDDDFERFILITHRTLEQLAYGSIQRRTVIIDRLFDIDYIDSIIRLLPIDAISSAIEKRKQEIAGAAEASELRQRYGSIEAAKQRATYLRNEVGKVREELEKLSSAYSNLLKKRSETMDKIKDVEAQYRQYVILSEKLKELQSRGPISRGIEAEAASDSEALKAVLIARLEENLMEDEAQSLSKASSPDELLMAMYKAIGQLEERAKEISDDLRQYREQAEKTRRDLERLRTSVTMLEERLHALEPSFKRYSSAAAEVGELPVAKAKLERLRLDYEAIESEARYKSALLEVINHLRNHGVKDQRCPICGSKLSIESLSTIKVETIKDDEVKEMRERLERMERLVSEMEVLHPIYLQFIDLGKRLEEARKQLEDGIARAEKMDKAIQDLERRYASLSSFIPIARDRLARLEEVYGEVERIKRIEEIRVELQKLEDILKSHDINVEAAIRLENEINDIGNRLDALRNKLEILSSEYMELESKLSKITMAGVDVEKAIREVEELEALLSRFLSIKDGLLRVQRIARQRIIEGIRDEFASMFRRMYPYGDLSGVSIELEQREKGDYAYALYALRRGRKVPMSRLSDGQRLTIAISFVLAMYKLVEHKFGFILMDEPLPYVDENVKSSFANLLINILREGISKQVIVATQDSSLMDSIVEKAKQSNIDINIIKLDKSG